MGWLVWIVLALNRKRVAFIMAKKVRVVDISLAIKEGWGRVQLEGLDPQQRKFWRGLADALTAKVRHFGHQESIPIMLRSFPGVPQEALPDGLA
jgi:hypothetical protein